MQKRILKVDKEFLKDYKHLVLILENCEEFSIDVADILDISCVAVSHKEQKTGEYQEWETKDGFIKLSKRAQKVISSFGDLNRYALPKEDLPEWITTTENYYLVDRLMSCSDLCVFSLVAENGNEMIHIRVPYNPLEDLHGCAIEYSNCASFEVNKEGEMAIYFGDSSKMPKRKDNNYAKLVSGWDIFKDFRIKVLKVNIKEMSLFCDEKGHYSLRLHTLIKNKKYHNETLRLIFKDCEDVYLETYFHVAKVHEIYASKLLDGSILVQIFPLNITFSCSSIETIK